MRFVTEQKSCELCPLPCAICKRSVNRQWRALRINREWVPSSPMVSDAEAMALLECSERMLKNHIAAGRIRFDKAILRHRLRLFDIWALKRSEAEKKAKKTAPQNREAIINLIDQLASRRAEEYSTIDEWLAEYGLVAASKKYTYGQRGTWTRPPSRGWYVYHLCRPNGQVFYVGKGMGDRMYHHASEARRGIQSHKCNLIRKLWKQQKDIVYRVVFISLVEQEAYLFEAEEMQRIGMINLTNIASGITYGNKIVVFDACLTYTQFVARYKLKPRPDDKFDAVYWWAYQREKELRIIYDFALSIHYKEALMCVSRELEALANIRGRQMELFKAA